MTHDWTTLFAMFGHVAHFRDRSIRDRLSLKQCRERVRQLSMDHSGALLEITVSAHREHFCERGMIRVLTEMRRQGHRDICVNNTITREAYRDSPDAPRYVRHMLEHANTQLIAHLGELFL